MLRRPSKLLIPLLLVGLTGCHNDPVVVASTPAPVVPAAAPSAEPSGVPTRWLQGTAAVGEAAFQFADLKVYALGQKQPLATGKVGEDNRYSLQLPTDLPAGTLLMVVANKGDQTVAGLAVAGNVVASGGANVVASGGANVVAPGGANVIAPGGGNVIAPGGGNVIAPGGGNVIAPGGGNVIAPGGGNVIAPGGGNVIAPGGGNVIAPGGGNVIAPGGGNVIAPGGGNVIAPGGGNVIAPGGANVVASGGANVVASGGANLTAGSTLAVGLLHGRFDALGQAGLTVASTDAASLLGNYGANVVASGGANVVASGGANVVAAGGLNMRIRPGYRVTAQSDPTQLNEVVSTYVRLVSSLDKAAAALPASQRGAVFHVVNSEGSGTVSHELAVSLQSATPTVGNEFIDAVNAINTVLRTTISSGGSAPDGDLLGTVTFGGVTGAPVLSTSGSAAAPTFGGGTTTTTTPVNTTPGAPVINGSAQ